MTKIKALYRWFTMRKRKFYFVVIIAATISDIYLFFRCCLWAENRSRLEIAIGVIAGVSAALCISWGVVLAKGMLLERFMASTLRKMRKIYFHGFKFYRYIDSDAILRLEEWLGVGICYELSALAMILMRNNRSARLCQGDYYDSTGQLKTGPAWVEVRAPLNGWIAIDFAWISPSICRRKDYYAYCNEDGNLIRRWICPHAKFWKIQFPKIILEAMQNEKTSCVLPELAGFCSSDQSYGFTDWIYKADSLRFSDGSDIVPYCLSDPGKPISTRILRDFVKRPQCKSPKAKSIRLARAMMRKNEARSPSK